MYSRMIVPEETPPPCDNPHHPLCTPPRFDRQLKAWTIIESYEAGLKRYATIARVLDEETEDLEPHHMHFALASFFNESGFRQDVHAGIGVASKGDCKWRDGRRVAGSCRSVCLGQINMGGRRQTPNGYTARDLVGVDREATRRCVHAALTHIRFAERRCGGWRPACIAQIYTGASWAMNPITQRRITTYRRVHAMTPPRLDNRARAVLGL